MTTGDLEAAGAEGLARAITRFDSGRGWTLRAFARWRVRMAMIDHLRAWFHLAKKDRRCQQKKGEGEEEGPARPKFMSMSALTGEGLVREHSVVDASAPCVDEAGERREFWALVTLGMGARARAMFLEHWRDGRTLDEIAQRQRPRVTAQTVSVILRHAGEHLRRRYAGRADELIAMGIGRSADAGDASQSCRADAQG